MIIMLLSTHSKDEITPVKVVGVGQDLGPILHVLFIDLLGFLQPLGRQGTDVFVVLLLTHVFDDGLVNSEQNKLTCVSHHAEYFLQLNNSIIK